MDMKNLRESLCPDCGVKMIKVNHKFKPPKKSEIKKWEVVKFLLENGFIYQHIYDNSDKKPPYLEYPEDLKNAIEFANIYKDQAIKKKITNL